MELRLEPNRTRILFVGDMHLGTRLSRLPAALGDPQRFGPGAAWLRVCRYAAENGVHAVALAGDVVNRQNELFEARRPLDQGLGILAAAGVRVLAVAGNHDTDTLPGLAAKDPRLELLGPGGTWSTAEVAGPDGPPVRVVGWSFPGEHWHDSPLATAPPAAQAGRVTCGLLHGDLDAAGGPYAPVRSAELRACGYDGWFLGHIHTPQPVPADGAPFYLGSLSGLDPTETGMHGPVLVEVAGDGAIERRRLDLAVLRWVAMDVPCDGIPHPEADPQRVIMTAIEDHPSMAGLPAGTALGVRAVLTGEVERPGALNAAVAGLDPGDLATEIGGTPVFVDGVQGRTHARVDLEALALDRDPLGLLAQRVLVLRGDRSDDSLLERLLDEARNAAAQVDRAVAHRDAHTAHDDGALRRLAAGSARRLLDRMLAAREAGA